MPVTYSFHRLSPAPYFVSLTAGEYDLLPHYNYINDPEHNGGIGQAAAADDAKLYGPNQGSYYVAFGEDAIGLYVNRPAQALAFNTDFLDNLMHQDLALPSVYVAMSTGTDQITIPEPISGAGGVFLGGTPTSPADDFTDLFHICDAEDEDLTLVYLPTGAPLPIVVIAAHDNGTHSPVSPYFSGGSVTLTFNASIPVGTVVRIYYGMRSNLASLPPDALTYTNIRTLTNLSYQTEDIFAELQGPEVLGIPWDGPGGMASSGFLSTIWDLSMSGLNERYNRSTAADSASPPVIDPPEDYWPTTGVDYGPLNTAGAGGWINRTGPALTIYSAGLIPAADPINALFAAKNNETTNSAGTVDYVAYGSRHSSYTKSVEGTVVPGSALFLGLWPHPFTESDTSLYTNIPDRSSVNLGIVGADATIQLWSPAYFVDGTGNSAVSVGYDMLEVEWLDSTSKKRRRTVVISEILAVDTVSVRNLDGSPVSWELRVTGTPTVRWISTSFALGDGGAMHQAALRADAHPVLIDGLFYQVPPALSGTPAYNNVPRRPAIFSARDNTAGAHALMWCGFDSTIPGPDVDPTSATYSSLRGDGSITAFCRVENFPGAIFVGGPGAGGIGTTNLASGVFAVAGNPVSAAVRGIGYGGALPYDPSGGTTGDQGYAFFGDSTGTHGVAICGYASGAYGTGAYFLGSGTTTSTAGQGSGAFGESQGGAAGLFGLNSGTGAGVFGYSTGTGPAVVGHVDGGHFFADVYSDGVRGAAAGNGSGGSFLSPGADPTLRGTLFPDTYGLIAISDANPAIAAVAVTDGVGYGAVCSFNFGTAPAVLGVSSGSGTGVAGMSDGGIVDMTGTPWVVTDWGFGVVGYATTDGIALAGIAVVDGCTGGYFYGQGDGGAGLRAYAYGIGAGAEVISTGGTGLGVVGHTYGIYVTMAGTGHGTQAIHAGGDAYIDGGGTYTGTLGVGGALNVTGGNIEVTNGDIYTTGSGGDIYSTSGTIYTGAADSSAQMGDIYSAVGDIVAETGSVYAGTTSSGVTQGTFGCTGLASATYGWAGVLGAGADVGTLPQLVIELYNLGVYHGGAIGAAGVIGVYPYANCGNGVVGIGTGSAAGGYFTGVGTCVGVVGIGVGGSAGGSFTSSGVGVESTVTNDYGVGIVGLAHSAVSSDIPVGTGAAGVGCTATNGAGLFGQGGGSGVGVVGFSPYAGVQGEATINAGIGVLGLGHGAVVGDTPNGTGVSGIGCTANAPGVYGAGGGSGAGGHFVPGTGTNTPAIWADTGPVEVSASVSNHTVAPGPNRVWSDNICKAHGQIVTDGLGSVYAQYGFNYTASFAGGIEPLIITLATPMKSTDTTYTVTVSAISPDNTTCIAGARIISDTVIHVYSGYPVGFPGVVTNWPSSAAAAMIINFDVFGPQ